jgi:hypothetical protein
VQVAERAGLSEERAERALSMLTEADAIDRGIDDETGETIWSNKPIELFSVGLRPPKP